MYLQVDLVVEKALSVQILFNTLGLLTSVPETFYVQKLNRVPKMGIDLIWPLFLYLVDNYATCVNFHLKPFWYIIKWCIFSTDDIMMRTLLSIEFFICFIWFFDFYN